MGERRKNTIVVVYGSGGHKEQMRRFLELCKDEFLENNTKVIAISETGYKLENNIILEDYSLDPLRDKYSYKKTFVNFFPQLIKLVRILWKISKENRIKGLISTGPGIAIFPSLVFRIFGKKIIFIETWSRFYTRSLTGIVMYRIANKFYIQNKSLKKLYPVAIYGGKL